MPDRMPTELNELSTLLVNVGGSVHNVTGAVANAVQQTNLAMQCGGDGTTQLTNLLGLVDASIHGIFSSLSGFKGVLQCENFNPIYTTFAYDGKCCHIGTIMYCFYFLRLCIVSLSFHLSILQQWSGRALMDILHCTQHGNIWHANGDITSGTRSILSFIIMVGGNGILGL